MKLAIVRVCVTDEDGCAKIVHERLWIDTLQSDPAITALVEDWCMIERIVLTGKTSFPRLPAS